MTAGSRSRSRARRAGGATSMGASRWRAVVIVLGLLTAAIARAQSPQEKQRSKILDELGLKKKPPAPPAEATPPPTADEPSGEGGEAPGAARNPSGDGKAGGAGKKSAPSGP